MFSIDDFRFAPRFYFACGIALKATTQRRYIAEVAATRHKYAIVARRAPMRRIESETFIASQCFDPRVHLAFAATES